MNFRNVVCTLASAAPKGKGTKMTSRLFHSTIGLISGTALLVGSAPTLAAAPATSVTADSAASLEEV